MTEWIGMFTAAAVFALLVTLPLLSDAFYVPSPIRSTATSSFTRSGYHQSLPRKRVFASKGGSDDEMNIGPGMEEAFKELEALQSLGNKNIQKPKEKDEAFANAIDKLDLRDILSEAEDEAESESSKSAEELELYKDMASELDVASSKEELIAADFKSDLELAESKEAGIPTIDTQKFMDMAIKEAIEEAKEKDDSVDGNEAKEAFLDNKEIMSEIEKIFDKANDDLLSELEEIRVEQAALAKEQAERNSRNNLEKIEENEKRMEVAQSNMKKMLVKVNTETKAVEDAIEGLKKAQAESEGGIDGQLSGLKSGGLVKQAALAGGLLFTLRSGAETVAFVAGDPSHALPALIQGVLAIACIAGFVFL